MSSLFLFICSCATVTLAVCIFVILLPLFLYLTCFYVTGHIVSISGLCIGTVIWCSINYRGFHRGHLYLQTMPLLALVFNHGKTAPGGGHSLRSPLKSPFSLLMHFKLHCLWASPGQGQPIFTGPQGLGQVSWPLAWASST
jgi:hypothetical protein